MKPVLAIAGLLTVVFSALVQAQPDELYNARVSDQSEFISPLAAMKVAEGHWMAFSIPAITGTAAPCCWRGHRPGSTEVGCALDERFGGHGTRDNSPETDSLVLFAKVKEGNVQRLQVVGEQCPVNGADQQVEWLGRANDAAAIEWLAMVAGSDHRNSPSHAALWAMSLHASPQAFARLKSLALQSENRKLRGEALFWMAEQHPEKAEPLLLDVIDSETDSEVLEQALFAISELPGQRSGELLLEIARDERNSTPVRRQAFFWLTQSDDEETIAALTELLVR